MLSRTIRLSFLLVLSLVSAAVKADEPAAIARALYGRLALGDLDGVKRLLAEGVAIPQIALYASGSHNRCVSLAELRVGEPRAAGERVEVAVAAGFAKLDPLSGRETLDLEHALLGMKRAGGDWRVDSWVLEEDRLADEMMNAASDAVADALLAAHPELLDESMLRALRIRGTRSVNRQDRAKASRFAAALHSLAGLASDDDALATAYGIDSMITRIPPGSDAAAGIDFAERGLEAARRRGTPDVFATALLNLSRAYQTKDGNTARGVPLLEQIYALRDRLIDDTLAERAAIQLVVVRLERGEYRACFPYLTVAREIAVQADDTLGLYSVENALALLFEAQHDYDLALLHYRRARELADKVHFVGGQVGTTLGIAHCADLLGREQEFRAAAADLLAQNEHVDPGSAAALRIDMAGDHLRRGELDEADRSAQEALRLADAAPENASKADAYDMAARVRLAQKRYPEALRAAETAIAYRTRDASVNQLSAWVLAARAHLAMGRRDAAYAALRSALQYGESERAAAGGSERQIALLFEPAAEAYSMLVDLLVEDGRNAEALLVAEKAKGRTLLDILSDVRSFAETAVPPAMLLEERRLESELVEANTKGRRSAVARARLELESYRSILDANRPQLHAARGAGSLQSVEALAPLLPGEGEALVEYVAGAGRLHVFVIRRGVRGPRVDVRTIQVSRAELERSVRRYAAALATGDLSYPAEARRLDRWLLAPVERLAPEAHTLCIVPDGALWLVPFESLLDARGRFAVERRAFFYAPSAAVLLRERATVQGERPSGRLFLGFGNPRLDARGTELLTSRERAAGRAPIPEAAREVETIARIVGLRSSAVFTGGEALESRLKSEAPRFRIIHLATHGVIDDSNPMYSHLLLSRRDGDGEDGALEAREMLGLRLHADLVVLSACDTAHGDVHPGEGLIGMSWALFAAGSPSVIASQWRVGSARTETLMTAFYRHWMEDRRAPFAKARALRAARLDLLRDPHYRHPFYWAPFVLIGSAD